MGIDSGVNISDDVALYGGKSAFTQLEHNIVAGYLITAGKNVVPLWQIMWVLCCFSVISLFVIMESFAVK